MKEFYLRNKIAVWIIAMSILVVGALVAYLTLNNKSATKPQVNISIDAPNEVASGSEIIYKVTFSNHDNSSLRNVSLDMIYPNGFTFEDSSPKPARLDGNQFTLNSLDPSQSATIMIRGTINGNTGETKTISAVMHYSFANFNSDFVAQAEAQTTIKNSDLMIQFEGPNKTTNSQTVSYDISYVNTTSSDIPNAKLKLDLPSTFKVSKYDISPDATGTIPLGTIKANSTNKFSFTGEFQDAGLGQVSFNAGITGNKSSDLTSVLIGSAQYAIEIDQVPLTASLSVKNNNAKSVDVVMPGDTLTYTVAYRNNSDVAATNVNISVNLSGTAYDLATIQASNSNISNTTISWDPSVVSSLASVGPGGNGNLSFSVQVKNPATKTTAKNLTLQASSNIKSVEYAQGFKGDDLSSKIGTVAHIDGAATYIVGANPPQAGQQTTYLVEIDLRNSTNDISGAVVTMSLPSALNFTKSSVAAPEGSNVAYDSSSKKLTWTVGKLAAHTGDFSALRKLQFEVTVQPSSANNNQPLPLAKNIELQGTDSFTSQKIDLNAADVYEH